MRRVNHTRHLCAAAPERFGRRVCGRLGALAAAVLLSACTLPMLPPSSDTTPRPKPLNRRLA